MFKKIYESIGNIFSAKEEEYKVMTEEEYEQFLNKDKPKKKEIIPVYTAIIQFKRVLLVKEEGIWTLPGGMPYNHSNDEKFLCEKISEYFPRSELEMFVFNGKFGSNDSNGNHLESYVYRSELKDILTEPSSKIEDFTWTPGIDKVKPSHLAELVIRSLQQDRKINNYI